MIDATKISNFNLTDNELEENILFWICAAGKNGEVSARLLNDFLNRLRCGLATIGYSRPAELSPFTIIREFALASKYRMFDVLIHLAGDPQLKADINGQPITHSNLFQWMMKDSGIGNHNLKSKCFIEISQSNINLRECSIDDLISIKGIGRKTAAGFLLHTRPNQRFAVIDTHILKFLRDQGIMVPKSTPGKRSKKYLELEKNFLNLCDKYTLDVANLDLAVWNHYRVTPKIPFDLEKFANDNDQSSVCCSSNGRG